VDTIGAKIATLIEEWSEHFTPEERVEALQSLTTVFCSICGVTQQAGQRCQCENGK